MYKIKNKWAEAFLPQSFTGGVHSTSRVESMNALVKRYVNSKNEISDFIRFLASFEQDSRFEEEKLFNEASNLAKNEESKEKKLGKDERNGPS